MRHYSSHKKRTGIAVFCLFLILSSAACHSGFRERVKERIANRSSSTSAASISSCDSHLPEINSGYGSEGPYGMAVKTISNPLWKRKQVAVFFPQGATGQRPVIFFSHGFGANDWEDYYTQLIRHMVSRGNIVVYSPYKTIRASFDERYDILWKGFELAAKRFEDQMDLNRVGFVGHSFGGGATPAMAYKGFVGKGWGQKSAFMYIMAPWYVFQISPDELGQFPKNTTLLVQIFDRDEVNDHRMAIDIYRNIKLPKHNKHFMVLRSKAMGNCDIVADHATPNRNPSLRIKQYGIFLPFDVLSDLAFNGNSKHGDFITASQMASEKEGYKPLEKDTDPVPKIAEKHYKFPWSKEMNPRLLFKKW